jgi:hypothetical protein
VGKRLRFQTGRGLLDFIGFLMLSLTTTGCLEKTVEPDQPTRRDPGSYTWTSDTLFYLGNAQTTMSSIYATSPQNVYVVGHCEVSAGRIWHFNGIAWQPVDLSAIRGDLTAIDGSSANNIWIAGAQLSYDPVSGRLFDSTMIAHFDGASWSKPRPFPRKGSLWCVDVVSPTSVWAGGALGLLYRLNGTQWELYELGQQYFVSSIAAVSANEAYAVGHVSDEVAPVDSSGSFLFRFNGGQWQVIDSVMRTPGAPSPHCGIGVYASGGVLYSISPNVYRRSGTGWMKLVDGMVGHMGMSSPENIFAVGVPVLCFNGFEWKELTQFHRNPAFWFACYTDGTEAFIVGNDNWKSVILHGK